MINVGIVGAGLMGKRRLNALKQSGDARLAAAADLNIEAARALIAGSDAQAYSHWEELVVRPDLDVVIVCTPPGSHAAVSLAAMRHHKHVLCEKPLAVSSQEADDMVRAAEENRVKLKCGFNHRFHPALQQAKTWIDQGQIGSLFNIRCTYGIGGRPGYDKEWRADVKLSGGGQLMDQGMHLIDLCRWFMGEFTEAFGYLATSYWDMAPLEDNAFALLRNPQGQIASLHTSWTQWKNLFRFEINGKDGYIVVDGLGGSYGTEKAILGKREFLQPFKEETIEFRGDDRSWLLEWQEFMSAIRENRRPLADGLDGLRALKISEAVYRSFQSRAQVAVSK